MTATAAERRLIEHVDRIEAEQPPIALETVDFTVIRPDAVRERFGPTLDYLARLGSEVDRNVLELNTMLVDPPEIDVRFYREVWHAQEIQHGVILDKLQTIIGRAPASPDTETVSAKMRILGAISHFSPVQDITRMLYYLTGISAPSARRCWPTTSCTPAWPRWARRRWPTPSSRRSATRSRRTMRSTSFSAVGLAAKLSPGSGGWSDD